MVKEEVAVQLSAQIGDLVNKFVSVQAQLTSVARNIEDRFSQASKTVEREMKGAASATSDSMQRIERSMNGPKDSLMGIADSVMQVRGAILASGIAMLFTEIAGAIKQATDRAQGLNDTAQMLELTGAQLQGLRATAVSAGFPLEKLDGALFKFNTTLQNAREGSDEAQRYLAAFGVTVDDLKNKNFGMADALVRVSGAIREYGITSETTAVVAKMFGKDNQSVVQVLEALGGSFDQAEEAARRFGALTDEQRATLARYTRETNELNYSWQNFKDTIIAKLIPALEYLGLFLRGLFDLLFILVSPLIAVTNAILMLVRAAYNLLTLDFAGAKDAWRDYGESVTAILENIKKSAKDIGDVDRKMRNISLTGSPEGASSGSGSEAGGRKLPTFEVPGKSNKVDDVALEKMELELEAARAGSDERIAIADRILAYVRQKYGEESREFFAALRAKLSAEREYAQEREKLANDMGSALQSLDQQTRADVARSGEEIGRNAIKELNDDLSRRKEYALNLKKINKEIFQDTVRTFESMLQPVTQAISTSIQGIVMGTQTARQALAKLAQSILLEFIDSGVKALMHHVATQLAMTQVTAVNTETRAALEETASKKSVLSTAWAAIKIIATKAAEVMASVYAAIAGIPYVGPFLAPAMAVAAGAAVMGYVGKVASARGGWEVPKDQLAMVHEQEMILPAPISKGLKDMISRGGRGGGGDVYNVNAIDARSVERFFNQNGRAMAKAMRRQAYRFNANFKPA